MRRGSLESYLAVATGLVCYGEYGSTTEDFGTVKRMMASQTAPTYPALIERQISQYRRAEVPLASGSYEEWVMVVTRAGGYVNLRSRKFSVGDRLLHLLSVLSIST